MFSQSKIKIITIALLVLLLGVIVVPQIVFAQASVGFEPIASIGLGTRDIKDIIVLVIRIFLGFLGIIAVSLLLYGGYTWMTAGGEPDKIEKAKKIITNAVIGLVIILAAYGIVMFVVSRFGGATVSVNVNGGNGPGGGGGGGDNAIFRVTGIQPRGELRIRNVVVQVSFNKEINQALINEAGVLTNQEGIIVERLNLEGQNERVDGALTIAPNNQRRVIFTPADDCPAPHQDLHCFQYDENNNNLNRYRVTVIGDPAISLRSVGGLAVTCQANSCQGQFTVGPNLDLENPHVNLTEAVNRAGRHLALRNGLVLSIDELYQLLATATDDGGVTGVDFYVAGELLDSVVPAETPPLEFAAQTSWPTVNLAPNNYELSARAYDVAFNESNLARVNVIIRPAHCFNGRFDQNLGETNIDCGGECGACAGELCGNLNENQCSEPNNQACASGLCSEESCRCVEGPQVTAIDPDNAAVGNWVTIFGQNFGNTPGTVKVGGRDAMVVAQIYNDCQGSWQDNQIIIELPQGLETGNRQIQVITVQDLASNLFDFLINDISRPAVCFIFPSEAMVDQSFGSIGKRFGDPADQNLTRDVYFGASQNGISATNQTWTNEGNLQIAISKVPNLSLGQTSVRVKVNGQDSNALNFRVLASANQAIAISDFTPKAGRDGQYVYIYGRGFGEYQANRSQVKFSTDISGSFDFPAECLADNSFWTDTRIIVKVPEGASTGPISVINANGQMAVSQANFDFQAQALLAPGICSLHPREGMVGSTFDVAGEYFENSNLYLGNLRLNASPDNEHRHFTGAIVPEGAVSGPVKAIKGELESNSLDFAVTGQGGPQAPLPGEYYQWQFTTCDNCLTPEVIESNGCIQELASPTPLKNSQNNFNDTIISATFNTEMNQELFRVGLTVVIEACGELADCEAVDLNGEFSFGATNENYQFFTLTLANRLNPDMWYKVTLRNLRSAVENLALAEPYQWYFKTRAGNARCEISNIQVNPQNRTIANGNPLALGSRVRYQANGYNQENCNICPSNFNWNWSSSDQNNASIDGDSRTNQSLLEAKGITSQTARITAQATVNQQQQTGTAQVDIVPGNPRIVYDQACASNLQSPSPYPNFQEACINAKVVVRFDKAMDETSILNQNNFHLVNQTNHQPIPGTLRGISDEAGLMGIEFTPQNLLALNSWYEVTLSGEIKSAQGADLSGPRAWQFKTKNSNQPCQFNLVLVDPVSAVLQFKATRDYRANPANSQTCQLLVEPNNLSWSWRSAEQSVATVAPSQSAQARATALEKEGETFIRATALDIENFGNNGRLVVTKQLGRDALNLSIIEHQPTGEQVCVNALAQIRFNLALESSSIMSGNFELLKYDTICPGGCPVKTALFSNQAGTVVNLAPTENNHLFEGQTSYGVRIHGGSGGIKTAGGEVLTEAGCSDGLTWEIGGLCQWQFTTQKNSCEAAKIQIEPQAATINLGQRQGWQATALAQNNQPLSDEIKNWRALNQAVANVTPDSNSHLAVSQGLGKGTTEIQASIDKVVGAAQLEVKEVLAGPQVISSQPSGNNICRNALIQINFDQIIDSKTVNNNSLKVQYISSEAKPGCEKIVPQSVSLNKPLLSKTLVDRLVNRFAGKLVGFLISSVSAAPTGPTYFCSLISDWTETISQEKSQLKFILRQALPPLTEIKVTVFGKEAGIKANGQILAGDNLDRDGNFVYSFRTRADICVLSSVILAADPDNNKKDWTFTTSFDNPIDNVPANEDFDSINDRDKKYTAQGYNVEGQLLGSIPEVYEWAWGWETSDQTIAELLSTQDNFAVIGAQNKNGQADITVTAAFPNWYKQPALKASALAKVDICENRWNPTGDQNPDYRFIDQNFNFSLSYCRDSGAFGFEDDLPALELPQPVSPQEQERALREVGGQLSDSLLREYLLPVPTTGDVIGIRIYSNLAHLSPQEWYEKNIKVKGQPIATTVDGYEAIQDGRTTYVSAANVVPTRLALNTQSKSWLGKLWNNLTRYFNYLAVTQVQAVADNSNTNPSTIINLNANKNINVDSSNFNNNANANYGIFNPNVNFNDLVNQMPGVQEQLNFNAGNFRLINQGYQAIGVQSGYTNIYLFSYNQNADPKTQGLLKRLMDKWQFNVNIDNPEVKEKIQRDVKRLADLGRIARSLNNYQQSHQSQYPRLLSGSFISGMSTSKWPSWSQNLSRELGMGLPVDPINKFNACTNCVEPQLLNSGFEEGGASWRTEQPAGVAVTLTPETNNQKFIKAGSNSLKINASGNVGGISQLVNLQTSTTYEMSAWVYINSGRAALTFWGNDFGNEWISPPDHQGWFLLKNRLVTNSDRRSRPNSPDNGVFVYSYQGAADFYVDEVKIQTAGGNCGYDKKTCWNPQINNGQGAFACDGDSYFYSYQTLGPANYSLSAKMETTVNWLPEGLLDPHLSLSTAMVRGCTREVFGSYCGDGSVQGGEQCEPGMSKNLCNSAFRWYAPVNVSCQDTGAENQCQWYNPLIDVAGDCSGKSATQCCGGYCGDSILNTQDGGYRLSVDEQCDASVSSGNRGFGAGNSINNQYACSVNCRDIGGWCGNGLVEEDYGEQCDGNAFNFSCGDNVDAECNNNCQATCPNGGEPEYHWNNLVTPG